METWVHIIGYPAYEVSCLGRVRNVKGKILQQRTGPDGALLVNLHYAKGIAYCRVANIVATAFCDNPGGSTNVRHLDYNLLNCGACNLYFG